jgi:predicted Fe-Mo cluster-binding NifX family protein
MEAIILGGIGLMAIPAIRAAIKSYRAKKAIADVVIDAVEAAVDAVDKK